MISPVSRLTRRAWIKGALSSPLWLPSWIGGTSLRRKSPVIIVGGGLSGLRLLDLCNESNIDALLLEASNRVGGRIRTLREQLPEGLRAEAGAERVFLSHQRVRSLARSLNVSFCEPDSLSGSYAMELDGKRHLVKDWSEIPQSWLDGLSDLETSGAPFYLHVVYCENYPSPSLDDPRSAIEWIRDKGLSRSGEILARAFTPFPLDTMHCTEFHRHSLHENGLDSAQLIRGGTDRLSDALFKKLESKIRFGFSVQEVHQSATKAWVESTAGDKVEGSAIVMCLPRTPLDRIKFSPRLDPEMLSDLSALSVGHQFKAHWQIPRSLLENAVLPCHSISDGPLRLEWAMPETIDGDCVVNGLASGERDCQFFEGARDESRLREILGSIRPSMTKSSPRVLSHDFNRDRLAGGSYAYFKAGSVRREKAWRDRRVILCGSDFSRLAGWMEGALISAEDALDALKHL